MVTETAEMRDFFDWAERNEVSLEVPIGNFFDDCLNFISMTDFDQ